MPLMTGVPKEHPLSKAWAEYQETDDFRNGFNWSTRLNSYNHDRGADGEIRRATDGQRGEWVKGALWAAFSAGFHYGQAPLIATPATVAELDAILNSEGDMPIKINPDGTVSPA